MAGGVGVCAVAAWTALSLPPATVPATGPAAATDVRVAYHVHTRRSDGTGSIDEVAEAASRAGLAAVILTDHGDGTRQADSPRYLAGVLVIDAVEISTWAGHYAAIGAAPSPYPLGGEPDAVVDDVRRLGGFGIAAHPGSTKEGLKWRDWDAPVDGVEWLNADSEWRDRPVDVWRSLFPYPWRPAETITALLNRPSFEMEQWDRLTARRPVVGLAAHDAHARLGLRGVGEPYDGYVALEVPGYEPMFRAFSNVVRLARPLSGDAARDAAEVTRALGSGRTYAVITGLAPSGRVRFLAESGGRTAGMGEHLAPVGRVTISFDADVPVGGRSTLYCAGQRVSEGDGGTVAWTTGGAAGACRVEVAAWADAGRVPWLVTNPIYVRADLSEAAPRDVPAPQAIVPLEGSSAAGRWAPELASGARARVVPVGDQPGRMAFAWQLGNGAGQYAAVRLDTPPAIAAFDRLILRATADRSMRLWVQLRSPRDGGHRWGRSVYVDPTPREIAIPFDALLALDGPEGQPVPLADITALLLVVDTVHARAGAAGTVTFDELWLAR